MFQSQKSYEQPAKKCPQRTEDSLQVFSDERQNDLTSLKDGLWTQEEVFKFISYLIYNRQALKLKLQRRTSKVFKQMAVFIISRTSVQCRSQNQRLFRKYKTMRNIVTSFKAEYGCDRFQEDFLRISNDPAIKFKTQYENYIQQHVRKACEVSTQTDSPLDIPLNNFFLPSPLTLSYEYGIPFNGAMGNWIIIPFSS